MIKKSSIIISSLGRTGTTFFKHFFRTHFPQIASFHEPATIHYKSPHLAADLKFNLKHFGFSNTIVKKALGRWGILSLSRRRILGRLSDEEAVQRIIKERQSFVDSFPQKYYLESNYHYYGLLDLLEKVFCNFRSIYIIRDPRDWVRSYINLFGWYHYSDLNMHIRNRLSAKDFPADPWALSWRNFSQFEKLCWAWNKQNSFVLESVKNINPKNFRLFRFEDIFNEKNGYQDFFELIDFVCSLDPKNLKTAPEMRADIGQKVHKPKKYFFPRWPEWTAVEAKILDKHCARTMERVGYGQEEKWLELISSK